MAAVPEESESPAAPPRVAPLFVAYFGGRFLVFVLLALVLYLVNFRGLPGLLAAAIASIPLSYLLFRGWRADLAARMIARRDAKVAAKDAFRASGS